MILTKYSFLKLLDFKNKINFEVLVVKKFEF